MASILLVVGLPVIGSWVRRTGAPRCALDGLAVVPGTAVRVTDHGGRSQTFCCIRCAERWLARTGDAFETVGVTDEVSGVEIDARAAVFVRSPVVTNRVTGNRVHTFRVADDAIAHTRQYGGRVLDPGERPFKRRQ